MRLVPFIVFCLLTFALAFALIHKNTAPTTAADSTHEVMPKLSLNTLEGKRPWSNDALKGKVTLINFFASWCAPCAAEMPELVAIRKQYPKLRIEGVVWNDNPDAMRDFLAKYGNPFHQLWLDEGGSAGIALGIRGIPESFIVDAQGIIRWRQGAPITPDQRVNEIDTLLTTLLAEAADAQ